ncbi:hypothetical protein KM043_012465 [Ampulex compressa]|nr:hypothetical protein KM043_012465 [Ampulex compressa]
MERKLVDAHRRWQARFSGDVGGTAIRLSEGPGSVSSRLIYPSSDALASLFTLFTSVQGRPLRAARRTNSTFDRGIKWIRLVHERFIGISYPDEGSSRRTPLFRPAAHLSGPFVTET